MDADLTETGAPKSALEEDASASSSSTEIDALAPQRSSLEWSELMASKLWPVAVLVLGASLWAQLFGLGLVAEGQFEQPRLGALIAYLIPLFLLVAGVWSRAPVILLTLFMVGSLPGLLFLPDQEKLLLGEGSSMLRIGLTLALFLAIASAGSGEDVGSDVPHEPLVGGEGSDAQETWVMQRFVMARIGVLAVLFALPAYAVFQDPEVASSLSKFYPEAPHVARTFMGLIHFFIWSVAAYMMVLVPSLNMEYDHRRLARRLGDQYRELSRKRLGIRVLAWVGVSACMIGVMLLLT
ncbi:MAG: hypothetical protein VYE40_13970 [Myxococcota bacterium]|nr:hypothetical protein [Myxococcota bacterium]